MSDEQTSESTSQTEQSQSDQSQEQTTQTPADESVLGTEESTSAETDGASTGDKETVLASADIDTQESVNSETANSESDAVPETYSDFELPNGIEMNKGYMDTMSPVFKELGLSQANAQKLINAHVTHVQEGEAGRADSVKQLHKDWLNDAKTDKDIGGDKFDASLKSANAAVNKFSTPEFKQLLSSTGLGNHPEIIRVFSKIGSLLQEDIPGNVNVGLKPEKVDRLSVMYPDDPPRSKL